jgi:CheY-like chemotaxis protein
VSERRPRVAVLDDDDDYFASLMEVLLREEGYRPERPPLVPGAELADLLADHGYDLAIVDLRGVAGNDLSVIGRLRDDPRLARLPILVCSADITVLRDNAPVLSVLPNVAALEKPFRIDVLVGVLERLLHGATPIAPPARAPARATVEELQAWLERLGRAIRWAALDAWGPDERPGQLRCVAAWGATERFEPFTRVSRRTHLPFGGGLPGRVWVSSRASWVEDVARDLNFPRQQVARRVGLVSAAAAPVLDAGATIGVVAAYTTMRRSRDAAVVDELVDAAGGAVGLFRSLADRSS